MIFEDVFNDIIYPKLKKYVEENSIYSPLVTKRKTEESKKFPIVPVKLLPITNRYNNLSYGEETYTFGIDINIYAIDNGSVSKRTICDEVTSKVVEFFKNTYHVIIRLKPDIPNVDDNVQRNNVKISGKLDTKRGIDNLIIYPY